MLGLTLVNPIVAVCKMSVKTSVSFARLTSFRFSVCQWCGDLSHYSIVVSGFSDIWLLDCQLSCSPYPSTASLTTSLPLWPKLHRRFDIRCYLPHILPPSCEFSSSSNFSADVFLPRRTHAFPPFNYAQQAHAGAPAWNPDGEHIGHSPFGGIPRFAEHKSPSITRRMFLAARSG